ncbi:Zinc/iron permease - like 8 [Theobroma cacao]|nr:Zinc/iron permease - like 8 [Theobroma cacao]
MGDMMSLISIYRTFSISHPHNSKSQNQQSCERSRKEWSMASPLVKLFSIFLIIISLFTPPALSVVPEECQTETNGCTNKEKALPLKLIAIFSILIASVIGVCSPLFTRSIPALHPDRNLFVIVKCFAAGIILATGFMHVLPDSFDMLSSSCLKENPWHKFPFTGFVAMLSAIVTLMVDSMATSIYSKKCSSGVIPEGGPAIGEGQHEMAVVNIGQSHGHGHYHGPKPAGNLDQQLLRYRVIAMAKYKTLKKVIMVFFFSVTTPFGIALGIAMSKTYKENSPTALITVGLLNASSAGLLIYMALVDLLSADFMGPKLQGSIKLQIKSYAAVLLGAGGMSLMAKWA